ncbi:RNA 2',3'-cyclic phosphodiesterase [candidate division WWE3 bacterium]|uniref:RNA 2',3'-cyclic phosphodiesterase n=1 Tax=candidate division WWE3 bacterium TaxID=2053526 RepID=A0A955RPS3_UNCKA|nr:RNA 2',3'-cyclic phosphodiesterase [candidate division WWE3 bacterium]
MRLFIAATLPPELVRDLTAIQAQLAKADVELRWVPKENMHITLSFLGEKTEDDLEKIKFDLATLDMPESSIVVRINKLEIFPRMDEPRVIVVTLLNEDTGLAQLGEQLTDRLGGSFNSPHITLGRFSKSHTRSDAVEILSSEVVMPDKRYEIREIGLYESELTGAGPAYTQLQHLKLSKR